jgi:hypothetical protein
MHPSGATTGALLGSPSAARALQFRGGQSPTRGAAPGSGSRAASASPARHNPTPRVDLLSRLAAVHAPQMLEVPTDARPPPHSPAREAVGGSGASSNGAGADGGSGSAMAAKLAFLKSPQRPGALNYAVDLRSDESGAAGAAGSPSSSSPAPPSLHPPRHHVARASKRQMAAEATPPGAAAAFAASDAMRTPAPFAAAAATPASASSAPSSAMGNLAFEDHAKHLFQSPMPPTAVPVVARRLCPSSCLHAHLWAIYVSLVAPMTS